MTVLSCPACRSDMQRGVLRGVKVDRCVRCRGLWLDTGELGVLLQTPFDLPAATEPAGDSRRRCPRCDVAMLDRRYSGQAAIRVDACPRCHGIFLDKGELQALEGAATRVSSAFTPEATTRATARADRRTALAASWGVAAPAAQLPLAARARFFTRVHGTSVLLFAVASAGALAGTTPEFGRPLLVPALIAGLGALALMIGLGARHPLALALALAAAIGGGTALGAALGLHVRPAAGLAVWQAFLLTGLGFTAITLVTRVLGRPLDWPSGMGTAVLVTGAYALTMHLAHGVIPPWAVGAVVAALFLLAWALAIAERMACTHDPADGIAAALDSWFEILRGIGWFLGMIVLVLLSSRGNRYGRGSGYGFGWGRRRRSIFDL